MAQQKNDGYIDFLKRWEEKHTRTPFFLFVIMQEPLAEGDIISVRIRAYLDPRDESHSYKEPLNVWDCGVARYLLREPLTLRSANALETALTVIQKLQGIDFKDGLAFMLQTYILVRDFFSDNRGASFMLFNPTLEQLLKKVPVQKKIIDNYISTPLLKLETLLNFWNHVGARISEGFIDSPDNSCGKPFYATIPPGWLRHDDLKKIYGEEWSSKIQITISSHLLPLVEKLPEIQRLFISSASTGTTCPASKSKDISEMNLFQKEGEYWTIFYKGMKKPLRIRDQKGLPYIAYLLANQGRAFDLLGLVKVVEGVNVDAIDNVYSKMNVEQLEKDFSGSTIKNLYRSIKKKRMRLHYLEQELKEAEDNHDVGAKEKLLREREEMLEEIELNSDNDYEKLRKYVNQCINRALKAIQEKLEEENMILYEHLKRHLTPVKFPICYNPDQNICWKM